MMDLNFDFDYIKDSFMKRKKMEQSELQEYLGFLCNMLSINITKILQEF